MVLACCSVFSRPAPRLLSLSPRQPLAAMELSLTGNSQSVLPPPLPTLLLLSARRGVRRQRTSPSPAAYPPLHSAWTAASGAARAERRRREERRRWGAWPWEERSSTRPRASGAVRAERAARASGEQGRRLVAYRRAWPASRYVSARVSNIHENNKNSDTPRIRI